MKANYFFQGPKNSQHATVGIRMSDGRSAGIGQEIELEDHEYELLSQSVVLSAVDQTDFEDLLEDEDSSEVTDLVNLGEESGTVEEDLDNN